MRRRFRCPAQDGSPGWAVPSNEMAEVYAGPKVALSRFPRRSFWAMGTYAALRVGPGYAQPPDPIILGTGERFSSLYEVPEVATHEGGFGFASVTKGDHPDALLSWAWVGDKYAPDHWGEPDFNEWGEVAP